VLGICISQKSNMPIAEKSIRTLVSKYGKHNVYRWRCMYPETCNVIGLKHYLHLPLEKSLLEK